MLKILTALICIISFGCGNLKSQSKEDSEIQEFIIDELAVAYPLPSPRKHPNLTKKDWDSINKIPTTIIINPIMLSTEIKKNIQIIQVIGI